MSIKRSVGELIRRYRLRAGLTQMQLAERLGITYQQLQKYEKGRSNISIERLYQIAQALNISPMYLLPETTSTFLKEDSAVYDMQRDECRLVELYRRLKDRKVKSAVLTLLEALIRGR